MVEFQGINIEKTAYINPIFFYMKESWDFLTVIRHISFLSKRMTIYITYISQFRENLVIFYFIIKQCNDKNKNVTFYLSGLVDRKIKS